MIQHLKTMGGLDNSRPMCAVLYNIVHEYADGKVTIANHGEPMISTTREGFQGRITTNVVYGGEYYRINCPFCQDTRRRLWINHRYATADSENRQMTWLAHCFNENCLADYENRRKLADDLLGFKNVNARNRKPMAYRFVPEEPKVMGVADPPGEVQPLTSLPANHAAYRYMVGCRRYTRDMLDHYQVHYCSKASPRYRVSQGYVIFPIMQEGICVGWQGRYPDDGINWKVLNMPKYYTMPKLPKGQILYNYDNAKDKPYVVVTEGVTDVHVVGDCGVAVLGKSISHIQRRKLLDTWSGKPIIFLFDPDARMEMEGIIRDLQRQRNGAPMFEVHLPDDYDAGDYDRKTLNRIIHAKSRDRGIHLPKA